MQRKILFIVNPNAGKKIAVQIIKNIRRVMPQDINYHITIWKDKSRFEEIEKSIHSQNYTDVIAVGGDGTVNEVAKAIINTRVSLGIVPIGSGNGLARSLKLSMNVTNVIQQILAGKTEVMDYGTVNGIPFFCTSGVGFDAHIGSLFAASSSRGLKGYVTITAREIFRYRSKQYTLKIKGENIRRDAFLITVANAGQYGNDFYIAPEARLQDGLFHVAVMKPLQLGLFPGLLYKILRKQAHLSVQIETFTTDNITIMREKNGPIHFDGEPAMQGEELVFQNRPKALRVIVGEKFEDDVVLRN